MVEVKVALDWIKEEVKTVNTDFQKKGKRNGVMIPEDRYDVRGRFFFFFKVKDFKCVYILMK